MDIGTTHYLVLSALLFVIGLLGIVTRRNMIVVLMSIELVLNSVNLNLVAFSYGTRTALVYLRRHPGRVRAVFLRGVAPPSAGIPLSLAADAQAALDDLFADCEASEVCNREFPNSAQRLDRLLKQMDRMPARVNWTDPESGEAMQLEITRNGFFLL